MSAYANRATNDYQRKKKLQSILSQNEHALVQMNSAEFIELNISHKQKQGMTRAQAVNAVGLIISQASSTGEKYWNSHSDNIKMVSGFIPVMTDLAAFTALAVDMQRGGGAFSTFQLATYSGKSHIIFQGYAGLRKDLTGTRYLANNPKVITMGIGKLGALNTIAKGGMITVIISAAFHSLEQMMNDEKTWRHFVGGMAVDIVIASASSLITWGLIGSTAIATTFTIGALLVVVVIGSIIVLFATYFIDTKYWSEKIAISLGLVEDRFVQTVNDVNHSSINMIKKYESDPIRFLHNFFGIPYFNGNYS